MYTYKEGAELTKGIFQSWLTDNPGILNKMLESDIYMLGHRIDTNYLSDVISSITNKRVLNTIHTFYGIGIRYKDEEDLEPGRNIEMELEHLGELLRPIYLNTKWDNNSYSNIPEYLRPEIAVTLPTGLFESLLRDRYLSLEDLNLEYKTLEEYHDLYNRGYSPNTICMIHNDMVSVIALPDTFEQDQIDLLRKLIKQNTPMNISYTISLFGRRKENPENIIYTLCSILDKRELPRRIADTELAGTACYMLQELTDDSIKAMFQHLQSLVV